ncbi:MAG: hypothetical protein U0136_21840 [Bdellovibrionota bacterium]
MKQILAPLLFFISFAYDAHAQVRAPDSQSVVMREEKRVIVNGAMEVWRLLWGEKPTECCMPKDVSEAGVANDPWETPYNCSCVGSGYGEQASSLTIRRFRDGKEIDRLNVRGYGEGSTDEQPPCLPRWPFEEGDEERYTTVPQSQLRIEILERPTVDVMDIADYDHDGVAAEFVLYAGYGGACGTNNYVLVGISKQTRKLQFLGTVEHPNKPVVMRSRERWKELLDSKPDSKVHIRYWSCEDHGAEEEEDYELTIDRQGLHGFKIWYDCKTRKELRRELL